MKAGQEKAPTLLSSLEGSRRHRPLSGEAGRARGDVIDISTKRKVEDASHEDLMLRVAKAKDRAAFQALFSHFAPRVKSYLMSLGLTASAAEDLMQEVLIKVWRKAEQFDPRKAKTSTWIFRIARNAFIDKKRRARYPQVSADEHLKEMQAPDETDRPVIEGQTADRVRRALSELKPDFKQVIELSFFEDLSHAQIAEHLALPLGTVKSRIRLGFAALRKTMGDPDGAA